MSFEDKMIKCIDCGAEFVHSGDDQSRYAERGFKHEPKRCRECREKRKAEGGGGGGGGDAGAPRSESAPSDRPARTGGFGHGPRREGGGGGGARGPRADGPPRESHEAVCAECGAKTTVPFKPSQGRPVFCRDCYRAKRR